ncbi:STN domain-containing protein [Steroidobacter sp. S1-65]|uniref:STN domain-containing protein n=1 Tax=Steroidobacter gossypii TaxID=2805490 RepID=A0ABS1WZE9_9GAMM|nr:STN domain-containing protein [Steroidobacter gossypii]MBM0106345.1 STN domain-containing protein [Steroidobacter gossypii]
MPSARAQADHSGEHFEFDIPAQPLADALRRFASLTREPTLFRSDLVNGRSSTAVRGLYTSEVALHRLLEGTGLTAEKSDQGGRGGFVLNAIDPSVVAPRVALGNLAGYPGLIQARVWEALCAHARTAPGTYRTLLRFEVDGAGQIQRPRLLTSTGDAHRDAAMLATLLAVRLDGPPPADLPQPVTMLIVPRDAENGDAPSCDDGASGA